MAKSVEGPRDIRAFVLELLNVFPPHGVSSEYLPRLVFDAFGATEVEVDQVLARLIEERVIIQGDGAGSYTQLCAKLSADELIRHEVLRRLRAAGSQGVPVIDLYDRVARSCRVSPEEVTAMFWELVQEGLANYTASGRAFIMPSPATEETA